MTRWHSPPAALHALVEHTPATVLLESAQPASADPSVPAPPTRLFTNPLRICVARAPSELPSLFAEIEQAVSSGLFAAGYFSYECGAFFEPTASFPAQPSSQPLAWFGIYRPPYLFDHPTGTFLEASPPDLAEFNSFAPNQAPPVDCTLSITEEQYIQRVEAIHALIRSGDVYQLNFTVPFHIHAPGSSAALYRNLRLRQPAPYGAFLHTQPNHRILSFSPELFFRLQSEGDTRRIVTRPMKGTAPRGRTTAEDRALSEWLCNDPKNRSENVMIVDLLRNDLGRLCAFGSVRAKNLFAVERYPTLWQMTSTIQGDLRPDVGFQQIFRALFPCGSITGAPKVRAMQLLSQLESQPRGIYTGAIGFFSQQETVFNVAIRTLALDGDHGAMGVGSGIVIDSNPADEFRECLLKAQFLTQPPAPASFSLIETLLWNGAYPLLDLHLDRLQDSASYFAFPFNREEVKTALQSHAAARLGSHHPNPAKSPANPLTRYSREAGANLLHRAETPHKVRLLLNSQGGLTITSEPIPAPASHPLRIQISRYRTNSDDPHYFHKTTYRPLYAEARKAAQAAGYDDVLFLNLRGELTETAIHNVFIQKAGRLLTPPIACGLLPGVHRRHLLATHPNAEERILTIDDLRKADAVYLCNAVRGLRPAIIDWETA